MVKQVCSSEKTSLISIQTRHMSEVGLFSSTFNNKMMIGNYTITHFY